MRYKTNIKFIYFKTHSDRFIRFSRCLFGRREIPISKEPAEDDHGECQRCKQQAFIKALLRLRRSMCGMAPPFRFVIQI